MINQSTNLKVPFRDNSLKVPLTFNYSAFFHALRGQASVVLESPLAAPFL